MKHLSDDHLRRLRQSLEEPDLSGTKYELGERVGAGGMATVYRGRDRALERNVAIKVASLLDNAGQMSARMIREAKIVALLEHPGVVPIHDVGTLPDGRVYYAMKLVEGQTLDQYAKRQTNRAEQLRTMLKVCDAIAFAHSREIVHRDLKPTNIMVGSFGEVLVMDWGIASAPAITNAGSGIAAGTTPVAGPTTSPGTIMGTLEFMSPEQARGDLSHVDHRADIYSLGAVLYFLLTGKSPVQGGDESDIRTRVIAGQFPRPRSLNSAIPRLLEAICLKAMSRNIELRYQTAKSLMDDLARFLDGEPVSAYRENVAERLWRWISRNKVIVLIVVGYMLVRFLIFLYAGK